MTASAVGQTPQKPLRTWRPMVFWTVGILLAAGTAWAIGASIRSTRETRTVLARFASGLMGGSNGLSGKEAVEVLGGPHRASVRLRVFLWSSGGRVRNGNMAAALLGYCGKPALPVLTGALRHTDGGVRRYAVSSLGMLGPDAAPAVPELLPFLSSDDMFFRGDAAQALGRIGPAAREATPALEKLLGDKERYVRAAAAEALKHIRGEELLK